MAREKNNRFYRVSPLGRYGREYILGESAHRVYALFTALAYIAAISLGGLWLFFKDYSETSLKLPSGLLAVIFASVCVLGLIAQIAIASYFQTSLKVSPIISKSTFLRPFKLLGLAVAFVSIVAWALLGNALVIDLLVGKRIEPQTALFFVLLSVGLLFCGRRVLKK